MIVPFAVAAAVGLVTFAVHFFIGGVYVVRPLLAAEDLTVASRWLAYYCWHIATVVILFMAGSFAFAAARPAAGWALAWTMCVLAFSLSALSAGVAFRADVMPWRFPSTSLFLIMGMLSLWGLLSASGASSSGRT